MKKTLALYEKQHEEIMEADVSNNRRARMLAEMMTEMEREFHIPMLRNSEWEKRTLM